MNSYAQINEFGVCVACSELVEAVDAAHMIPIDQGDFSMLGRRWTGTTWEDMEDPRPSVVITGVTCSDPNAAIQPRDVTCLVGSNLSVAVELRDAGGVAVSITTAFRMPLVARDGRERILLAQFVDGIAIISTILSESGCWRISEETINSGLPDTQQMRFDGLEIYVVQA